MRAILFDFGGTLDFPRHWLDRFLAHYRAAGITLTRAQLDPAFEAATHHAYASSASLRDYGLAKLIPLLVRFQIAFLAESDAIADLKLATESVVAELTRRISDSFIAESMVGLERSRALLSRLKPQLAIGVVSNFYGNLELVLKEAGFEGIVSAIADSGRLGVYKPEPAIFRTALSMLGVSGRETVMVGDSLDKDCAPARGLGMRTIWLCHEPGPGASTESADFTITSLDELELLLCRIV
jgi:HAD superfamily hydrolase (TIGR01549 family)